MSFNASGMYVDYTAEDGEPRCADCAVVLDFYRDGTFQQGDALLCETHWLARFDATIAASEQRAADRAGAT